MTVSVEMCPSVSQLAPGRSSLPGHGCGSSLKRAKLQHPSRLLRLRSSGLDWTSFADSAAVRAWRSDRGCRRRLWPSLHHPDAMVRLQRSQAAPLRGPDLQQAKGLRNLRNSGIQAEESSEIASGLGLKPRCNCRLWVRCLKTNAAAPWPDFRCGGSATH
jgi:hypothetical protein